MGENIDESGVNSKHIRSYDHHFIDGEWTSPCNAGDTIEVSDSNTGKPIATIPAGTEEDTLKAIEAAKNALPAWSKETTPKERWDYINAFLERFVAADRVEEIVERLAVELGCTKAFAKNVQHVAPHYHTKTILDLLDKNKGDSSFEWEEAAGTCTIVKEPIGVVGAITPWNYPLHQIALKVIPALLAGCTVVLKPSEVTPLSAYSFAEAMDEAGLPKGVFNMIMGKGPCCGEVLARHPGVDLVSFTGSTRAGKILTKVAADSGTMKAVRTELGGKSASVLLEDADFNTVVPPFVKQLTSNTGQSCNALSRMLVPRDRSDEVCEIVTKTMKKEIVGCTTDPNATIGPLVSETQYNAVRSYIERGISEGARLVIGGPEAPEGTKDSGGYFVKPTLFADVTNDMTIAREEIFGPVLCVIPYDTEEEAIKLANDTPYGLNNAVASGDLKRALKVASKLQSGTVMVNKTQLDLKAPFGGYKQSGNAREWGIAGLEEYLITKTVNLPLEEYRAIVYGSESKSSD
eukprot:CAMPEP_0116115236 /NCGR_PEP_ID=MMETSP0329-20121206/399_1 /TAXON_ID=697910 /ORGANISM="Pseudo-nitzschia arenysensis, Strain B593" /LENGTH=518 /DNA_ID=CAMNT_0003608655 /DNA_START=239 /DNA_END=1795 /DNA_ORIENTATION=-